MKDFAAMWQPVDAFFQDNPLAYAVAILVLATLLAKMLSAIVTTILGGIVKRTPIQWDDQLIAVLQRPLFWSVLCAGAWLAATLPHELSAGVGGFIESSLATVLVIVWSGFLLKLVHIVLLSMSQGGDSLVRSQTLPLFENLAFLLVIAAALYAIFLSWHIDMTAWLASAGIVGIAIGFAAKDTLANLFSGVFILADAPYKIGDYVVLDSGERGKVTRIGIRSTRLQTRDDVEITIPNAIMGNSRIVNESGGPYEKFRLRVSVGVAYGSDIDQVKAILMDVALAEPEVCEDPEPRVRFRAFGASSLDIDLLCWIENPELRGRVLDTLNTTIYKRFAEEGVEIPYSKHDIFIKEMPS